MANRYRRQDAQTCEDEEEKQCRSGRGEGGAAITAAILSVLLRLLASGTCNP
jgi:hypothetical protein